MRNSRFKDYLRDLLTNANDPRISRIEQYEAPGMAGRPNLRVVDVDGRAVELIIVNTSAKGDDMSAPEVITRKSAPGVTVT